MQVRPGMLQAARERLEAGDEGGSNEDLRFRQEVHGLGRGFTGQGCAKQGE